MVNKSIVFLLVILLFSCTARLSPLEYKAWLEDPENGLLQETKKSGLTVKAFYRPQTYLVLNDLGLESLSDSSIATMKKEYAGIQYYELVISMDSSDFIKGYSRDKNDYMNNLYYFTFAFQKDISLIYPGIDTIPVNLYHFERSYGMSYSKKFLIGFEDNKHKGDRLLHIDSPLLPTGVINVCFDATNIDKASAIEIKI